MGFFDQEKLVVGCLLGLDEVWHFCDFFDVAKELADPFTTGERLCHRGLFTSSAHPDRRRSLPANLDGSARKRKQRGGRNNSRLLVTDPAHAKHMRSRYSATLNVLYAQA